VAPISLKAAVSGIVVISFVIIPGIFVTVDVLAAIVGLGLCGSLVKNVA
jgi:hypothetical protein